ncbi:MAG: PfkB family carbohydrate kinase [Bacillota bacterium]|nr:hypothetical protein [Bacillota bacterium]
MAADIQAMLLETARKLEERLGGEKPRALIGFDGFVDEIIDVVATRHSPTSYQRFATIAQLAKRIADAAGLSTNLELVTTQVKLGGNGPIMANALAGLGVDVTYIGSVGYPAVHPVFEEFAAKCRVISICEPGHTDALEFDDGKLMLGKYQTLDQVRWERIVQLIPVPELAEIAGAASLIAAVNWTMLPHLTEVWERFLAEVLPQPEPGARLPIVFFDLCDPAKRQRAELVQALKTIQAFTAKSRPILGLNRKEATEVATALGLEVPPSNRDASLRDITVALGERLGLYGLVVHPTREAAVYMGGAYYHVPGPYTPKPRLTTGAGDNFNAGFCLGQMLGFSPQESLALGAGTSGFYVRNRRSPEGLELPAFLRTWAQNFGSEF